MAFILQFVLPITIILALYSPSEAVKRALKRVSYGSPCNASTKCDIHSLLTCEDNICQCLYQDAMIYNPDVGSCVSVVNEVCGYLERKKVFINCVPNAFCDQQQGICKCSRDYVESTSERNCIKQKGFGEPCHSDSECLRDLSLICFEETCQCDPENFVVYIASQYESSTQAKKCVSLAGNFCSAKTGCIPKASCFSESDSGAVVLSSAFGWMHAGVCKCDPGYEMDETGYCRGKYGSQCDTLRNIMCSKNFRCVNGLCQCKYPDDQVYHDEAGECFSVVGGPCTLLEDVDQNNGNESQQQESITCDAFLECKIEMGSPIPTCSCKQGFVENRDRGCDLTFGQPCTGDSLSKCDEAADLHCIDGNCECKDDLKAYDSGEGKCVGKIGSSCVIQTSGVDTDNKVKLCTKATKGKSVMRHEIVCAQNATCQLSRNQLTGLSSRGVCVRLDSINVGDRKAVYLEHPDTNKIDSDKEESDEQDR